DVTGEADEQAIDAAIIAAAQALEHYEITRYGSLIAWAKRLDREDCAVILEQNLQEEQAADQRLPELAERDGNRKGAGEAVSHFTDCGAPEGIRTPDPQIRSLVLYPAELPAPTPAVAQMSGPAKAMTRSGPDALALASAPC